MQKITSLKDIEKLGFWDGYIIDVFPVDPDALLEDKNLEDALKLRDEIQKAIEAKFSRTQDAPIPQLEEKTIRAMKEHELVQYAQSIGIQASTKDKKADTLVKVLKFLWIS